MKIGRLFMSLLLIPSLCLSDIARLGVLVVDEITGEPLPNVLVRGGFRMDNGWDAWVKSARPNEDLRRTDVQGRCKVQGKTNCGKAGVAVKDPPPGYYRPSAGIGFSFEKKSLFGTWLPDNLVATIRLQRVGHPIPLCVKKVGDHVNRSKVGDFNGTNMVFRYDLMRGDYLPPDGKGEVADVVVETRLMKLEMTNSISKIHCYYDYVNTVSFPGEGNGMVTFLTRSMDGVKIRVAPVSGYESSTSIRCGVRKRARGLNVSGERYSESEKNRGYCFRIRSRYDEKGNLVGGFYGKIYGDFSFGYFDDKGCSTEFFYYLNPTPLDTNLEWDCKTNLSLAPGYLNEFQP